MTRRDWTPILDEAAGHARGRLITLRQVHYLLVSNPQNEYRNTETDYNQLSRRTAEGRREGWFPPLADETRRIEQRGFYDSIPDALESVADDYRLDRTQGQDITIWLALEKATLLGQARQWTEPFGIPIVAIRGYGSQTIADDIYDMASDAAGVETHLLYIGDHDPSGVDIQRDLVSKTGSAFTEIERIAIRPEQVQGYQLAPAPGKSTDTRAGRFIAEYGDLIQVEVEAMRPDDLRQLLVGAIEDRTDLEVLQHVQQRERAEKEALYRFIRGFAEEE